MNAGYHAAAQCGRYVLWRIQAKDRIERIVLEADSDLLLALLTLVDVLPDLREVRDND